MAPCGLLRRLRHLDHHHHNHSKFHVHRKKLGKNGKHGHGHKHDSGVLHGLERNQTSADGSLPTCSVIEESHSGDEKDHRKESCHKRKHHHDGARIRKSKHERSCRRPKISHAKLIRMIEEFFKDKTKTQEAQENDRSKRSTSVPPNISYQQTLVTDDLPPTENALE